MTYHNLSMQLTKLFELYGIAMSLRDMVTVRARLVNFARRTQRLGYPCLATEAIAAAGQLEQDILRIAP